MYVYNTPSKIIIMKSFVEVLNTIHRFFPLQLWLIHSKEIRTSKQTEKQTTKTRQIDVNSYSSYWLGNPDFIPEYNSFQLHEYSITFKIRFLGHYPILVVKKSVYTHS